MRQGNTSWPYILKLAESKSVPQMEVGSLYVLCIKSFAVLDEWIMDKIKLICLELKSVSNTDYDMIKGHTSLKIKHFKLQNKFCRRMLSWYLELWNLGMNDVDMKRE